MRIGMVSPYSLSFPGGVQGQVLGLARTLRRKGHDVRVIAPTDGPPPEPGVTSIGRSIPFAANGSVAPIAPDPAATLRTIRAEVEEGFDVIHLHEPVVPGPCLTTLIAKPAPIVGTFHAAGGFALYRVTGPLLRLAARRIDVRCAVSDDAALLARQALGGRYEVLFNGIDVERFSRVTAWPSDRPTILFVGRHEPRKGLAVLLEAAQKIDGDIVVWVAGEGPQTAELQERYAGDRRIEWLGRLGDEELLRRLRGADVFCAPSLHGESFGIVLLEAMASGTPIVAGNLPGYRRVARPGLDAVLVEPGDAGALAEALERVLSDGRLAEALVTSGEARAAEFSMDALADRYLELYADL